MKACTSSAKPDTACSISETCPRESGADFDAPSAGRKAGRAAYSSEGWPCFLLRPQTDSGRFKKGDMMKTLKEEIQRLEDMKGNVVLVKKATYLSLLNELKVLRFKVRKTQDWDRPVRVASMVRYGYMHRYWYPETEKGDRQMAEIKAESVKVAEEKIAAFQKYIEDNNIHGFALQDFRNAVHAQAFRSNLAVEGQNLPFMILLDDSVYTILQVQIAASIARGEKREKICAYLNDLNEQYRMLKYTADAAGNVLLTCCIPAGVPHFEPALVIAILNQIQGHLNAVYPEIMKKLWEK